MKKFLANRKFHFFRYHCIVSDEEGNISYEVHGKPKFFKLRLGVFNGEEKLLFGLSGKSSTSHTKVTIHFYDGSKISIKQKCVSFFNFNIITENEELLMKTNLWGTKFHLIKDGEIVGEIKKKLWGYKRVGEITAYDEKYCDLLVAFMVIIDLTPHVST